MVEDQPLCRLGVRMSLADTDLPCELVGEAETVEQAVSFLKAHGDALDLILLDYVLPDGTGSDVISAARRSSSVRSVVSL